MLSNVMTRRGTMRTSLLMVKRKVIVSKSSFVELKTSSDIPQLFVSHRSGLPWFGYGVKSGYDSGESFHKAIVLGKLLEEMRNDVKRMVPDILDEMITRPLPALYDLNKEERQEVLPPVTWTTAEMHIRGIVCVQVCQRVLFNPLPYEIKDKTLHDEREASASVTWNITPPRLNADDNNDDNKLIEVQAVTTIKSFLEVLGVATTVDTRSAKFDYYSGELLSVELISDTKYSSLS